MKVFLGGTCSGWQWRNKFQKMLKCDYYNPMTHGWNEKDRQKEVYERKTADVRSALERAQRQTEEEKP